MLAPRRPLAGREVDAPLLVDEPDRYDQWRARVIRRRQPQEMTRLPEECVDLGLGHLRHAPRILRVTPQRQPRSTGSRVTKPVAPRTSLPWCASAWCRLYDRSPLRASW